MQLQQPCSYVKQQLSIRTQGKTLWDAMLDMYERYGYYQDHVESITLKGIEGLEKIKNVLETLRNEPLTKIGDYTVLKARDYQKDTIVDLKTKEVTPTGLPKSNVLYYELNDDAWVCIRPSGTEPKVKFYIGVKGTSMEDSLGKIKEFRTDDARYCTKVDLIAKNH